MFKHLSAAVLAAFALASPAKADEAVVRAALDSLVPGTQPERLGPAPIPGYTEVSLSGQILYVSNDGKYLIEGSIYDVVKRDNLTESSRAKSRKTLLAGVSSEQTILFSPENPDYTVKVFTDIDCGYCRRLHQQIAEYNAKGIAVQYLFFPRGGLGSESYDKAVSVWCSADKHNALTRAKAGEELPKTECDNPIDEDFELGRQVGLGGTPAIYTSEGVQIGGYLPPDQMRQRLDQLAGKSGS
ncbi:MAG TPA: disulfide bond formation protein DsbC [Xanthomonadales bacterium]|nr:disulfide bond formation protein DsbC [Xanthomonadales bacterium]